MLRSLLVSALLLCTARGAAAQSTFLQGPYVDRVVSDAATLHLRTPTTTSVHARFEAAGTTLHRVTPPGTLHRIVVSGLPVGQVVSYSVEAHGFRTASGRFRTPPADRSGPVDFVAIGDSRDGDAVLARIAQEVPGDPAFVLHLGDYVPRGSSVEEWTLFTQAAAPLLARATIVPVLGNHELIARGGDRLYREQFALPAPNDVAYYVFDHGPVRVIVLDSNDSLEAGSAQHAFALRELERAAVEPDLAALFVAVHHGPFSSARHGGLEVFGTSGLVDAMRRAHVDLVLSGHDHVYERGDSEGLKYVITGGAGSPLYSGNSRQPYQLAFATAYHSARLHVERAGTTVEVVRPGGSLLERCSFARGGSWSCERREPVASEEGTAPIVDQGYAYGPYVVAALVAVGFLFLVFRRKMSR